MTNFFHKPVIRYALIASTTLFTSLCSLTSYSSPKSHYQPIVSAAISLQSSIEHCLRNTRSLTQCSGGAHGIPENILNSTGGLINSIIVVSGVITTIPNEKYGIVPNDTYIRTPNITSLLPLKIEWKSSGGGVAKGYAK